MSTYLHLFSLTSDHVGPLDILVEIFNNSRNSQRQGADFALSASHTVCLDTSEVDLNIGGYYTVRGVFS